MRYFLVLMVALLLSACSDAEQQAVSSAPRQAVEQAEQVQQQLDEMAVRQRQEIDQAGNKADDQP